MENNTVKANGLSVTFDDKKNEITFEWDGETHPEWNIIEEIGQENLLKMLTEKANEILTEKTNEICEDELKVSKLSSEAYDIVAAGHKVEFVNRFAIAAIIKVLADKVAPVRYLDADIDIKDVPEYILGCIDRQEEIRGQLLNIAFELETIND
jgi:hypothetical protein